jgi:hypothetical protein
MFISGDRQIEDDSCTLQNTASLKLRHRFKMYLLSLLAVAAANSFIGAGVTSWSSRRPDFLHCRAQA